MKVEENGDYLILKVPATSHGKKDVANLMAYRGLTFSNTGSSVDQAVLFSENPYSLADLASPESPKLGAYRRAIDLSRALDGKGTSRVPAGKELWPYQKATLDYLLARGGGINGDQPGLGKRLPVDEPVLTPNGWVDNGTLRVGDEVIGADGRPTKIVGAFEEEKAPYYVVTFSDGRKVRCDPQHLWEVQQRVGTAGIGFRTKVLTTQNILDTGLEMGGGTRGGVRRTVSRFYVPLVQPIQFVQRDFDIDPYTLGAFIGDGSLTGTRSAISVPDLDNFIVKKIQKLYKLSINRSPSCPQYRISGASKTFWRLLERLGLRVRSKYRFIPSEYLQGSVEQRVELLRGLMDTDGSCSANRTTYHTVSSGLAQDVAELARSLGGWAKVRTYDRGAKGVEFQVNVRTPMCPFSLPRKVGEWRPSPIKLAITSIVYGGEAMQRCIKVADPRALYVTSGYTLTHNTPTSIAYCNEREATRVLVIVPAALRLQWKERIQEWSTIPKVKVAVMLNSKDGIHPTAHYQVVSYETARNPAIVRAILRYKWDILICDEAHKLKNIDAITTRAIIGNARGEFVRKGEKMPAVKSACKEHLYLTGTLLLNRPSEAYVLFRALDWEAIDYMSEDKFKETYNRQAELTTIQGKRFKLESTSLETELQNRLRAHIMARHEKSEVLKDMKPPRYSVVRVQADGDVKAALDAENLLDLDIDKVQSGIKDIETQGHIAEVRRMMGVACAPQIAEYATEFLEDTEEKLVLFCWHHEVMDIYQEALKRYGVVRIDGKKSTKAKQEAVNTFINDPGVRVVIGNMQSMGTGTDGLQEVCWKCYIAEPDWVPAQNEQAVSRLDRFGQVNDVSVEIFVAPGSITEKIFVRALQKLNTIHKVLDDRGI